VIIKWQFKNRKYKIGLSLFENVGILFVIFSKYYDKTKVDEEYESSIQNQTFTSVILSSPRKAKVQIMNGDLLFYKFFFPISVSIIYIIFILIALLLLPILLNKYYY